ncbi:MAG: hypothetical protein A3J81_07515, partial [Nitrospirae bacterium RIFOXYB2_FULL_43_5]
EYTKRKDAFEHYALLKGLKTHFGPGFAEELWQQKSNEEKPERCKFCYRLRLIGAAKSAKKLGFEYFSTTLLVSPQQNHELIRELALEIAENEGLKFVYRDLRHMYYKGKNVVKEMGLYSQKYCGCMPSLIEKHVKVK